MFLAKILAVLLCLLMMLVSGCGGGPGTAGLHVLQDRILGREEPRGEVVQKSELVMDTVAQLTAAGPEAAEAVNESFARLKELEGLLSNYREDSDAARLRESAGTGQWVQVSPEMYHLLEVSQHYSELTEGAWDITSAPLIKLWGIGTDKARVPSPEEIQAAKGKVGWQKLELDGHGAARLTEAGMELDLGGIAKGYALDEVRKIYQKHGIENGLINLGSSSIYGVGFGRAKVPWRIGIRNPRQDDPKAYLAVASLSAMALSTSGDYERYFEAGGVRYHHIIDPRTGYPAWCGKDIAEEDRPWSVLVLADGKEPDSGLKSDLLTTAVFVLGQEKGTAFLSSLQEKGIAGFILTGDRVLHGTGGIGELLSDIGPDFQLVEQ